MATEEVKKENLLRMTELSLEVLAAEVWDTLGESSMVLGNGMGDAILEMMEKEEGFELDSSHPMAVATEMDRIFVDEFGFAKEITASVDETGTAAVFKVNSCINTRFTDKMLASGVKLNYTCPIMLVAKQMGPKMGLPNSRVKIERWQEGNGCIIHIYK